GGGGRPGGVRAARVGGADVGDRRSEHGVILRPPASRGQAPKGCTSPPPGTGATTPPPGRLAGPPPVAIDLRDGRHDRPPRPRRGRRRRPPGPRPPGMMVAPDREPTQRDVRLDDGRTLRAYDACAGADDASTIVWHHGSPQTGAPLDPLRAAAAERGIRLLSYAPPGYGGADARARAARA